MALREAQLFDGDVTAALKFDSTANLFEQLKARGWDPKGGVHVFKEGDREILLDKDVPSGEKIALHMKRRKTGELMSFLMMSLN